MRVAALSLTLILCSVIATAATTIHVCPDGSGDYPHLRAAVDAAASGDEIELCEGTFTGPNNAELYFGPKDLVLRSLHGADNTVIDFAWIDGEFDELIGHPGIELAAGTTTRIEGVTLQNAFSRTDGGALRAIGASLILDRVRIVGLRRGAQRGAGVFMQSGTLEVYESTFVGNKAWEGGAIFSEGSWVTLQGCTIGGSGSCSGGVVVLKSGRISDCVFEGNRGFHCDTNPGGNVIVANGGSVLIERCRFTDNVDVSGGCARVYPTADVVFENCLIEGGEGESDGVIAMWGGKATFRNTTFRNNFAGWTGGAISGGGVVTLEQCSFINNDSGGTFRPWAGAIDMSSGELRISACTFYGSALRGGATIALGAGTRLSIENTIIAFGGRVGSTFGVVHCRGPLTELTVRCSDIFGNAAGDWVGCVAGMEGADGNFSADPLFCNATSGDLTLRSTSPCAPAQSGDCGLIGALPVACAPTAVQSSTWGSIKGLYR